MENNQDTNLINSNILKNFEDVFNLNNFVYKKLESLTIYGSGNYDDLQETFDYQINYLKNINQIMVDKFDNYLNLQKIVNLGLGVYIKKINELNNDFKEKKIHNQVQLKVQKFRKIMNFFAIGVFIISIIAIILEDKKFFSVN